MVMKEEPSNECLQRAKANLSNGPLGVQMSPEFITALLLQATE